MWQKDGKGNWFMAGLSPIEQCGTSSACWVKNDCGEWYLQSQETAIIDLPVAVGLQIAL
jgi:hypothetical protein